MNEMNDSYSEKRDDAGKNKNQDRKDKFFNIEINIEDKFQTSGTKPIKITSEPEEAELLGKIVKGDLKVYVENEVWQQIENYSKKDMNNELGGVLIGDLYKTEKGNNFLRIDGFIDAKYGESKGASFKFTHKAWEYIHQEKEQLYPELGIIGWYHTHPGYGVFLSSYDLFIQKNFFNLPYQIALVIDPRTDERGFFQWKNGDISKCDGFYIYGERIDPKQLKEAIREVKKQIQLLTEKVESIPIVTSRLRDIALIGLAIGVIYLSIDRFILVRRMENSFLKKTSTPEEFRVKPPGGENIELIQPPSQPAEKERIHFVKKGETLWDISKQYLGDGSRYNEIAKLNGISNTEMISEGQELKLPVR